MASLTETHVVTLADGRRARVQEYDDGSVHFTLGIGDGGNYAITEAYLSGKPSEEAVIKLVHLGH